MPNTENINRLIETLRQDAGTHFYMGAFTQIS